MKISAIAMVRNESDIIKDTIDHVKTLVDDIYVYDDCSTDNTLEILKENGVNVIEGKEWKDSIEGRNNANGFNRQQAYLEAIKGKPDYIYCFDADERADFEGIDFTHDYYKLRLFDFYMTVNGLKAGPEYRDIVMLFKPNTKTRFLHREPTGIGTDGKQAGYVKHYSKCISEERWEEDCKYYIKYFPAWAKKWEDRKGKFIHEKSDFGRPLIEWSQRYNKNIKIKK